MRRPDFPARRLRSDRFFHATAVRVNRSSLPSPGRPTHGGSKTGLSRFDHVDIHDRPDLAAEQVEKHGDALAVAHGIEHAEMIGERSADNANPLARPESAAKPYQAALVLAAAQLGNDLVGKRRRPVAMAHQLRNAECRADRSPALAVE